MSAIHIRGNPSAGQRVFRYRSRITRCLTEFIPERGMITIRSESPNGTETYNRISRRDFLLRAEAFSLECRRLRQLAATAHNQTRRKANYEEAEDKSRLVACMVAAAQAARQQGDPFSRGVTRQVAHDNRKICVTMGGRAGRVIGGGGTIADRAVLPPLPTASGTVAGPNFDRVAAVDVSITPRR